MALSVRLANRALLRNIDRAGVQQSQNDRCRIRNERVSEEVMGDERVERECTEGENAWRREIMYEGGRECVEGERRYGG